MHHGTILTTGATAACAGTDCRLREAAGRTRRPPVAGSRLCPSCRGRLGRELRDLSELYEECGRRLGGDAGRTGGPAGGGTVPEGPLDVRAVETRTLILQVLSRWACRVAEERELAAPRRAIAPLVGFLVRHAAWLAAHEAAGEVSEEVARTARGARRAVVPPPGQRVSIGACVEQGCGGGLTAVVWPERPEQPAEIRCDAHPSHRWLGHRWLQLSRRHGATRHHSPAAPRARTRGDRPAGGDGGGHAPASEPSRWVAPADVARLWGVPMGSVYRHASTDKWRRRNEGGRAYYHATDVHETLARRATAEAAR
ncbi:hypothetical protein ACIQJ4_35195 [Streptomyces filamentosus]|uniref:hypothetical protein n=1 Tax=Streptomyces filamentosus TaxID=67294 RepID=UPI003808146F